MPMYMTLDEIAAALQLDRRTVKKLMLEKGVAPIKVGRLLRWKRQAVMDALTSMHQNDNGTAPKAKKPRPKKSPSVLSMNAKELFQTFCTPTMGPVQ